MSLKSFMKDIIKLIKDYKWVILIVALITTLFSLLLVRFIGTQSEPNSVVTDTVDYTKVGSIDFYADGSFENFQVEPHLPEALINNIHEWETFRAFFSLNSSNPTIRASQPINEFFDEQSNPIQDFLGIDPTQHNNIKIHPDTGNAYATVEINPETGNVRLVNVQEGFNDFRIQLDVDAEEGTFATGIGENVDDLLHFKIGMTPGAPQLGYIESVYNWQSGVNFPRMFAQKKNFYITDPVIFDPPILISSSTNLFSKSLIIPGAIAAIIGLFLGVALSFVLAIFDKNIKYSFTYGWAVEDLYLQYNQNDQPKQIMYDMLQSNFDQLAVISEVELPAELSKHIENVNSKQVKIVKAQLPV